MKTSVLELGNLIQGFKLSCQTEGLSPKTTEWYTSFLLRFLRFLEQSELPTQLDKIEKTHIRQFILHLQQEARTPHTNKPLSGATVQGYVRTLKAFSAWAERKEYTPANLMFKIPIPKAWTDINLEEGIIKIRKAKGGKERYVPVGNVAQRFLCIILMLVDSAMRISELANIKINDIDVQRGFVTVFGKGQKQRVVPISRITMRELLRYLNRFRQDSKFADSPYLFQDNYGGSVTVNSIQQYLRRLAQKAGLGEVKVTPHIFRHTAATNAAAQGANAFILKEMLGHSSMQTTLRYVHLQPSDLKIQHNKFSIVNELFRKK